MDDLLRFIALAFAFIVLLPLFVYFVVVSAAPKKTNKEKITVLVLIILFVGLMLWDSFKQGQRNEIQTFILGFILLGVVFLDTFEIKISKLLKISIVVAGVGMYLATGEYL